MILSLPFPEKTSDEEEKMGIKILTDPNNDDSDTVKYYMRRYPGGTIQDILLFLNEFDELLDLKHVQEDDGPSKFQLIELLLTDRAKKEWLQAKQAKDNGDCCGIHLNDVLFLISHKLRTLFDANVVNYW